MPDNEKQFEQDIESFLISPAGGWQKASDAGYRASMDSGVTKKERSPVKFAPKISVKIWSPTIAVSLLLVPKR